jgi:hypothetical protein
MMCYIQYRGDAIITSPDFFFHEGWGYLCIAVDPKCKEHYMVRTNIVN